MAVWSKETFRFSIYSLLKFKVKFKVKIFIQKGNLHITTKYSYSYT